jgi:2-isopropylmalate synthase
MKQRLSLFDTTLRDGAQTAGIDFSLEDKILVAEILDELGVDYVEGGYPGANPKDDAFFAEPRTARATFTAFGMVKRPGVSASNDPGLAALIGAAGTAICFVAKAWDFHVRVALGAELDDNLTSIRESVEAARAAGKEVLVDCEHFFDGYKANPDYALACAEAAYTAGARWVVLCDTNGGTLPHEVEAIVAAVAAHVPGDHLGIHAHNDTEQAVAVSLAAVNAGARQIQGTLAGIGERCGNANLLSIIPTLMLKPGFAERFETGITGAALGSLTQLARRFDDVLNRAPARHAPYVGVNAFATKAGIHASAILKDPKTYEHVAPDAVGNQRRLLVSDQSGRSNIMAELDRGNLIDDLERKGLAAGAERGRLERLLAEVKDREARGYSYETADASFELLARRMLSEVPEFFDVKSYRVVVERRHNALGELISVSEAVVKVEVDGQVLMSVGEGNGPVNALDNALRKDLGKYQAEIAGLDLVDYKVRILSGGTGAVTRVLIESLDTVTHRRWVTIGVSENIVDASFEALMDSITFKLLSNGRMGATAPVTAETAG